MLQATTTAAPRRFPSVDVLRGWAVALMLLVNYPGSWAHVYAPLEHSEWNGFTPTDLVFPTFLYVVGVSIALGLKPGTPLPKMWARALRLIAVGWLLYAVAMWGYGKEHFRIWGVLQRIGLCYGAAATLALWLTPRRQWGVIAGLLLGYWALLVAGGGYLPWDNLASRVDTWVAGVHNYQFDVATGKAHDPEGLLSTLPALATTLLGVRAGHWLRERGLAFLLRAGVALLAVGWAWAWPMPWNKNLWTSSYAVYAAGWSTVLLASCHALFDRCGAPPWGRSMGINAIAAYAGSWLLACLFEKFGVFGTAYAQAAAWLGDGKPASLAVATAFVALWWGLMWGMEKKGWRVTI